MPSCSSGASFLRRQESSFFSMGLFIQRIHHLPFILWIPVFTGMTFLIIYVFQNLWTISIGYIISLVKIRETPENRESTLWERLKIRSFLYQKRGATRFNTPLKTLFVYNSHCPHPTRTCIFNLYRKNSYPKSIRTRNFIQICEIL